MKKSAHLAVALLASGSALAITSYANAQAAPAGDQSTVQEVVVTGSRVIANGNNSPTPITVLSTQALLAVQPTTIYDALETLPVFQGSTGVTSGVSGAGGTSVNANVLNLRALGESRSLILYDGHRVPPTEENGLVDVTAIPQLLIQRVDVVTGGASAVYGSDAVAGVVNFITDTKFSGVKFNIQSGISARDDDPSYDGGVAFGHAFLDGRLHVEGSVELNKEAGLFRYQRPAYNEYTMEGAGTAASPYFLTTNGRIDSYTFGGLITGGPLANMTFDQNGVLSPFNPGSTAGTTGISAIGGDGTYDTDTSLVVAQQLHQEYLRVDFDVTNNVHFYLTGAFNQGLEANSNTNTRLQSFTVSSTNAFLPAAYQQTLLAAKASTFIYSKMWLSSALPHQSAYYATNNVLINPGFDGNFSLFGHDFKWDTSWVYGVSQLHSVANSTFADGRFFAALDSVVNPANGQPVCRVTLTNPTLYPGCVPINVFGPSSESAAAIAYVENPVYYNDRFISNDVSGSLSGAPFSTWAGPVTLAVSGEWRRLAFQLNGDSPPSNVSPQDCTGLVYNCVVGSTVQYTPSQLADRPPVYQQVSEIALEGDVPVLKDRFFIQSADLNLAIRHAYYSDTGNANPAAPVTTTNFESTPWKIGLDVHVNDQLTVRATRSVDIRAPNLYELFAPSSFAPLPASDLLTNTTTRASQDTTGNAALTPETGYTTTAGIVYKPDWLPRFSLAVDWYDIRILNEITTINGTSAQYQNSCYASGGSSFYCTLQTRALGNYTNTSAANAITEWFIEPINIAEERHSGVDFEANYSTSLLGHPLTLRGLATYMPNVIVFQPGALTVQNAGVIDPVWRTTISARFKPTDSFTIDWQTRWRSGEKLANPAQFVVVPGENNVAPVAFSNLNLSYALKRNYFNFAESAEIYLNIQNVFDTQAPLTGDTSTDPGKGGGFVPGDDVIGRYFTLGLRLRL